MGTEVKQDTGAEVKTPRLVVWGNIIAFDSTAHQISNISTVAVADVTTTTHYKRSWWPFLFAGLGVAGFWNYHTGVWVRTILFEIFTRFNWPPDAITDVGIVAALVIFFSVGAIILFKSTISNTRTFLSIEMNSGRRTLIASDNKEFVVRVAITLVRVMSKPISDDKRMVVNFDNRSINIENAENSNIIGGNISNSVVNSI